MKKDSNEKQKNELIALKLVLNSCEKDTTFIEPIRILKEDVRKELEKLSC